MAIITDPDDLSRAPSTDAVTDITIGSPTARKCNIASATTDLIALPDASYFVLRGHSDSVNNGLWQVDDAAPATSDFDAVKISGDDPVANAVGEAADIDYEMEIYVDVETREVALIEQGALTSDGVDGVAVYSFLMDRAQADTDMNSVPFPLTPLAPKGSFRFKDDWTYLDESTYSKAPVLRTSKLIRSAGLAVVNSSGVTQQILPNILSLGTFEDATTDQPYFHYGSDQTLTTLAADFEFAGPINEVILARDNVTPADTGVGFDITNTDTIERKDGGDWATEGYVVGGQIVLANCDVPGNDGTYTITSVVGGVDGDVVVSGTLTNDTADQTLTASYDNTNSINVKLRVRDGDPKGKTFSQSNLTNTPETVASEIVVPFPVTNATDPKIDATDASITGGGPWDEIFIRYFDAPFNQDVDLTDTERAFGICIDVGTFSGVDGASATSTTFSTADAGIPGTTYDGGVLTIHEGTDKGDHTITTATGGTVTLSGALTATESDLSFTLQQASPVVGSNEQSFEKTQYQLRQNSDINDCNVGGVVVGKLGDEIAKFVGDNLQLGAGVPTNPAGGGSGVTIQGYSESQRANLSVWDNTGTERTYPFQSAGNINHNQSAQDDASYQVTMYFQYSVQTTVTTFAISSSAGNTASLDSTAEFPSLTQNDYVELNGFTNATNNGLWQVTDASPTASQFDARKVNGDTVVDEGSASRTLDQDPYPAPGSIIVDDATATDIQYLVAGASKAFTFDYTNNAQGGRTPNQDADIVLVGSGKGDGQFFTTEGTITEAVGLTFAVSPASDLTYNNP